MSQVYIMYIFFLMNRALSFHCNNIEWFSNFNAVVLAGHSGRPNCRSGVAELLLESELKKYVYESIYITQLN